MEKITIIQLYDGSNATIKDTKDYKALRSEEYNFFFDKKMVFLLGGEKEIIQKNQN